MARQILRASESPNDGVRRLRELLRYQSAARLAMRLGCDSTAVRRWARGARTPSPAWRERLYDVLGIPVESWELVASDDDAVTQPRG